MNHKKNTFWVLAGMLIISAISCNSPAKQDNNPTTTSTVAESSTEPPFKLEGSLTFYQEDGKTEIKKMDIEVAKTDAERMQGLMYRKSMKDNQAMLFVFEEEDQQAFWMKNTVISLDIIYVNAKKEVVSISKYAVPFSEESLPSVKPAQYVVEVNAGLCDKVGIKPGSKIDFTINE